MKTINTEALAAGFDAAFKLKKQAFLEGLAGQLGKYTAKLPSEVLHWGIDNPDAAKAALPIVGGLAGASLGGLAGLIKPVQPGQSRLKNSLLGLGIGGTAGAGLGGLGTYAATQNPSTFLGNFAGQAVSDKLDKTLPKLEDIKSGLRAAINNLNLGAKFENFFKK